MKPPTLITGLGEAMRHLSERQRVVAQNIANSETPGFKAREVEAPDFGKLVGDAAGSRRVARPRVQITGGMAALGANQPLGGRITIDKDVTETKPDGNNVTLEEQLLKMGQIQADFTALTNLYRKQMSLMKTAVGKGN
ncbi:MAG: flagellar basal body protein [Pseudomonadota bacterium]|nr:flagellar basal body protein [Pseudomonadota bacterium]